MPKAKSKLATRPTSANRKQLAATQAQFKKIESRLAALDKEYAAVQAATGLAQAANYAFTLGAGSDGRMWL